MKNLSYWCLQKYREIAQLRSNFFCIYKKIVKIEFLILFLIHSSTTRLSTTFFDFFFTVLVGTLADVKATCVARTIPEGAIVFEFEFPYKNAHFLDIVLSRDDKYFICYGLENYKNAIYVFQVADGSLMHTIQGDPFQREPLFHQVIVVHKK